MPGASDLEQLARLVRIFGSINETTWPGVGQLPDYDKLHFAQCQPVPLSTLLPEASAAALRLLTGMLRIRPEARLAAKEALADAYFDTLPLAASQIDVGTLVGEALTQQSGGTVMYR